MNAPLRRTDARRTYALAPWLALSLPGLVLISVLAGSTVVLATFSFFGYERGRLLDTLTLESWRRTLGDPFFWDVLFRTLQLSASVTALTFLIGYPLAYAMTLVSNPLLLLVANFALISPLVVSIVVRAYGWLGLLAENGLINRLLMTIGVIEEPLKLTFNAVGVDIALVHALMPFMVFPLVGVLRQVQLRYKEAAADLGAGPLATFSRVTFPLTLPGVISGCQIVFVISFSAFVIPSLMGGGRVLVASRLAYENVTSLDWPRGAIQVFALLAVTLVGLLISNWLARRTYLGSRAVME